MSFDVARAEKARRRRRRLGLATLASFVLHAAPLFALVRWPALLEEPEELLRIVAIERLEVEESRPVEEARFEAEDHVFVEEERSARQTGQAARRHFEGMLRDRIEARVGGSPRRRDVSREEPQAQVVVRNDARQTPALEPRAEVSTEASARIEKGVGAQVPHTAPGSTRSDLPQTRSRAREVVTAPERPEADESSAHPHPAPGVPPEWTNPSGEVAAAAPGEQRLMAGERVDELDYAETARLRARQASMDLYLLEVRRRVEPHWRPRFVLRGRHADEVEAALFSRGDHALTRVAVRLDARGNIREVKVSSTSGLVQLDRHAVTAFRNAAPFPPPPRNLLDGGELTFEWGARARY